MPSIHAYAIRDAVEEAAKKNQIAAIDTLLNNATLATSSPTNKRSIQIQIDAVTVTLRGWREGNSLHVQADDQPEAVIPDHFA